MVCGKQAVNSLPFLLGTSTSPKRHIEFFLNNLNNQALQFLTMYCCQQERVTFNAIAHGEPFRAEDFPWI